MMSDLPDRPESNLRPRRSGAARHHELGQRAIFEFKKFAAMAVYLWIVFGLFVLLQSITLKTHDIPYTFYGFAAIKAMVLAKIWLIAHDLHFASGLNDRPLIVSIIYKTAAFTLLFFFFEFAATLGMGLWKGQSFAQAVPTWGGGGLEGSAVIAVIVGVSLLPAAAFIEIGRVVGERRLLDLLLKPRRRLAK